MWKERGKSGVLTGHPDDGDDHFFHADTAVLESITVIIDVIVIVIGVAKEAIALCKNKGRVDGGDGKSRFFRVPEGQHFFGLIVKIAAMLIPQVGSGLFVTDHLKGAFYANAAMIGGEDEIDLFIGNFFECLVQR